MQAQSSKRPEGDVSSSQRRFFNCNRPGHLAWECRSRRTESSGRGTKQRPRQVDTRQVYITEGEVFPAHSERTQSPATTPGLLSYLLSTDSEDSEDGVRQIRISDQGSRQQHADILIEGVPARGIIDSGAEITIIGGELLRRIAARCETQEEPAEATGRWRKLSRPWHGPYRVTDKTDPDITCVKVYHPQEGPFCYHTDKAYYIISHPGLGFKYIQVGG